MSFRGPALLALLALSCGRSEVFERQVPVVPPPITPMLPPVMDPCMETSRPCKSGCGAGIERCVGGVWTGCDAPAPLDPPPSLAIAGTVRDFHQTHPDFENLIGDDRGIVGMTLGPDRLPTYPHSGGTKTVTSPESFSQWYRDAPGINRSVAKSVTLKRISQTPLVYSFTDNAFFPIDGQLFGDEGNDHNFHFTFELHTEVEYRGGEALAFQGDDDLWVFLNNQLVVDLGGPHSTQAGHVLLDALGLKRGEVYPLDVFFAERHRSSSTLRVETTNARFLQCPP